MSGFEQHQVVDVLAIHDLIARFAHVVDGGTLEEYGQLFTEDAVWSTAASPVMEMAASQREGRVAIVESAAQRRAEGVQGPGTNTRHFVSTVSVRLTGPDTAEADAYWTYVVDTLGTPTIRAVGVYENELRRVGGVWKLSARRLVQG